MSLTRTVEHRRGPAIERSHRCSSVDALPRAVLWAARDRCTQASCSHTQSEQFQRTGIPALNLHRPRGSPGRTAASQAAGCGFDARSAGSLVLKRRKQVSISDDRLRLEGLRIESILITLTTGRRCCRSVQEAQRCSTCATVTCSRCELSSRQLARACAQCARRLESCRPVSGWRCPALPRR